MANTDSTRLSPRLSPCSNSPSPDQGSPRNNNDQSLHIVVDPQPDGHMNMIHLVNPQNGQIFTSYLAENGACIEIQPGFVFRVPFPQTYRPYPPQQFQQPTYPPNAVPCGMQLPGGMYMPSGASDYFSPRCPVHGSPNQQASNGYLQNADDPRLDKRREKLHRKVREKHLNQSCICVVHDQGQPKGPKHQPRRDTKMNGHSVNDVTHSVAENTDGNDNDAKDGDDDIPVVAAPKISVKDGNSIQLSWADCVANNSHLSNGKFELEMGMKEANFKRVYCGGDVEYLVENLRPATQYNFRLRVKIDEKRGKYSDIATATTPCVVPSVPSLPKVTQKTKTSLVIKWNASNDGGSVITAYSLQWNNGKPKSEFEEVYKGPQRQYKLTHKLPPSTPCKFRLRASNAVGWSDFSQVLECLTGSCPPETPDQPQLVKATSNSMTLKWAEPKDNGAPVTEYKLEMDDDKTGYGFKPVYCGESKQFTYKGLTRDTTYKFRLLASNVSGSSKYCSVVSFKTLPEAPGKIDKPHLVGKAKTHTFTVTWDPPKDTGGPEITAYDVEMCDAKCVDSVEVHRVLKREFSPIALLPGHTYKVRVFAIGTGGKSVPSVVANITTLPVCPGKPNAPRLSSKHKHEPTTLFLEWDSPKDDGGSAIVSFSVKMHRPTEEDFNDVYEGSKRQCNAAGLQPGELYLFKIQAVNKAGASPWSDTAELHTAPGAPDAPSAPNCICRSPTHIRLEWEEPMTHGSAVTGYVVEQLHEELQVFVKVYDGQSTFCEVKKGLQPATYYYFRIQALSDAGASLFSAVCSVKTLPAPPAAVTFVKVLDHASGSALLHWKHPADHGASITHYVLEISGATTSTLTVPIATKQDKHDEDNELSVDDDVSLNGSCDEQRPTRLKETGVEDFMEYDVTGLLADTAYRIRVQAMNRIGSGPFSHPAQFVTKELPPSPPNLELISSSHQSLKLKWGESVSPRRSNLGLNFTLQMKNRSDSFTPVFTGMGQSFSVSKLKELSPYTFRINAKNDAGDGSFSEPKTFHTKAQPPSAVKELTWKKLSTSSASLTWHPVDALREDDSINYIVQKMLVDQSKEFSEAYCGPNTEVILTDLVPDQEYQIRVSANRLLSAALRNRASNVPSQVKGPINGTLRMRISQEAPSEISNQAQSQQVESEDTKVREMSDAQVALLILGMFLCVGLIVALTLWFYMGEIAF